MSQSSLLSNVGDTPPLPGRWSAKQSAMIDQTLVAAMPRGRGTLTHRTPPKHMTDARVCGKAHIVMVSYYPSAQLAKKSAILRQTGNYFVTLLACCIRDDFTTQRFFDQAYEVQDYQELWALLMNCRSACVHAFIHPWIIGALAVAARALTGTRTVIDVNDSQLFLQWATDHPQCEMEKTILHLADAFTHKMPAAAIREMRLAWDLETPDAQIDSLPLSELFVDPPAAKQSQKASPAIVFAGGVIPYALAQTRGHECHIFDPMIETICASGLSLTMYVNQNARDMSWHEHQHYLDYALTSSNFRFEKGVPFFALPERLAVHDFGLYYENSPASSYNPKHFQYNMATKVFSYLEAGLPVLVPKSAPYIRDLVVEHGLGLTYELEAWPAFMERLKAVDYQQLVANVRVYRQAHSMVTTLECLGRIYNTGT